MKYILWLAVPLIIITIVLALLLGPKVTALAIGDQVPDFRLKDLQGNDFFWNNCRGKVVLVNFWATWCVYCREELPSLEEFNQKYGDKGLVTVSILKDANNIDQALKIKEGESITYPILLDKNEELFKRFGITSLPYTALVDHHGKIRFIHLGFAKNDLSKFEREIGQLLEEKD